MEEEQEEPGQGQFSLKEIGMISFLTDPRNKGVDMKADLIKNYVRDGLTSINSTLRALEEMNVLERRRRSDMTMEYTLTIPEDGIFKLSLKPSTFEERIFKLFRKDRPCSIIAWLFEEIEADYPDDVSLVNAVDREMAAAKVVQFWTDDKIEEAFNRMILHSSGAPFRMSDILNYLNALDSGKIK